MQKSLGKRARIAALAISRQVERHNENENENEDEDGLKDDKVGKGEWQNTQRKTKQTKARNKTMRNAFCHCISEKTAWVKGVLGVKTLFGWHNESPYAIANAMPNDIHTSP